MTTLERFIIGYIIIGISILISLCIFYWKETKEIFKMIKTIYKLLKNMQNPVEDVLIYESPKILINFNSLLIDNNIPVITIVINKNEYNFLIDSGCNVNILEKSVFLEQILDTESDNNNSIIGIQVSAEKTYHTNLSFTLQNKEFIEVFEILDASHGFKPIEELYHIPIHGILGCEFFKKYKVILDFNTKFIEIPQIN